MTTLTEHASPRKVRRHPAPVVAALSLTRKDLRILRAKLTPIAEGDRDVARIVARLRPAGAQR